MKNANWIFFVVFLFISNFIFAQNCETGTDDPPGCLYECAAWSAPNETFSRDFPVVGTNCSAQGYSRWFRFKAVSSDVTLSMSRFSCSQLSEIYLQVYDESFNSLTSCQKFTFADFSGVVSLSSIVPDTEYLVKVESTQSLGCDFEIMMQGISIDDVIRPRFSSRVGDFLPVEGTITLGPSPNADFIEWTIYDSLSVIESGQGTSSITYSKPRFHRGELVATLSNECGADAIVPIPIFADDSFCIFNSDAFPGCDYNCESFWALDEEFAPNSSICSGNSFAKFLKVKADGDEINITSDRNLCDASAEFNVQLFDAQQNPLGSCVSFRNNNFSTQIASFTNLIAGDEYSILIESSSSVGCDFNFNFEGIELEYLDLVSFISLLSSDGVKLDSARTTNRPGSRSYLWEFSEPSIFITSRPDDLIISFENPNNLPSEICVTPMAPCKKGTKYCQKLAVSNLSDVQLPCCTAPDTPAGCEDAGITFNRACTICDTGGVYTGNTEGYGDVRKADCGLVWNSSFVSVIADANGVIEANVVNKYVWN